MACNICNRTFANRKSLDTHKNRFHSNQKGEAINIKELLEDKTKNEIEYDSDNSWTVGTYVGSTSGDESAESEDNSRKEIEDNSKKEIEKLKKKTKMTLKNTKNKMKNKISLYRKLEALENEDEPGFKPIEDAIFNEPIMAEIIKIEKLASKYKFDEIIENHLETLQKMIMALSYGVIPLTKPQRSEITDFQRKLVEGIEISDDEEAGNLIRANVQELANFFAIIEDSLKLTRKSFHKFPLNKDAQQISSESEESTMDDY